MSSEEWSPPNRGPRRSSVFVFLGRKNKATSQKDKYEFARRMALHGTLSQPRLTMKVTSGAPLSKSGFLEAQQAIGFLVGQNADGSNASANIQPKRSRSNSTDAKRMQSPLYLGILSCQIDCVEILLEAGFDPADSRNGLSAYDTALLLYYDIISKDRVSDSVTFSMLK